MLALSLPEAFVARMQQLLGDEYDSFQAALLQERSLGLRVNTLKLDPRILKQQAPWQLTPIPWCPSGFYYEPQAQPGKHAWHAAGAYYLQDPAPWL